MISGWVSKDNDFLCSCIRPAVSSVLFVHCYLLTQSINLLQVLNVWSCHVQPTLWKSWQMYVWAWNFSKRLIVGLILYGQFKIIVQYVKLQYNKHHMLWLSISSCQLLLTLTACQSYLKWGLLQITKNRGYICYCQTLDSGPLQRLQKHFIKSVMHKSLEKSFNYSVLITDDSSKILQNNQ